uniref:Uncharacterized protein n=1 Tax=viral metagenome TaxID=1070528 RepID=A0A6C0BAZ6_9ZZZZ
MIRANPTTAIPIAADIPGVRIISLDEDERVVFVVFTERVVFVVFTERGNVAVGVTLATILKEDTELEVTEGDEEEEEEGDPVTEGEKEGKTVTEAEGEGLMLSVAEGEGDLVAVAVDADPRAQQRVTEDEKVLPSINWHP